MSNTPPLPWLRGDTAAVIAIQRNESHNAGTPALPGQAAGKGHSHDVDTENAS